MEEYFYYSIFDIAKHKHGTGRFTSLDEAIHQFARMKNMTHVEFQRFFKVEKKK